MKDLIEALNRAHKLDEAAFSGGYAEGGNVIDRHARPNASVQPDKKSYLGRLKNNNPDLVDIITVKGKDVKRGMITQSGQVKEAEVKKNNRGETKVYIMHTNNYDGFWDVDQDMEVLADPENRSKPFTGDYRALLKMGLKESAIYNRSMNESPDVVKDYARVDAKEFVKHPMNYDVTSMLEFEVRDDVKVYIHRGPGRQREFYIIIGDTYVQHAFNKLETVEKYLRRNNLVKEVISESFHPGDVVYVTVCNRLGHVRKMISPDVVEVELFSGPYPERIDRYYVDEVELEYSDGPDDDF